MDLKYFLFLIGFIFSAGCTLTSNIQDEQTLIKKNDRKQLIIWMLSDIQPDSHADRVYFENAIIDVRRNIGAIDIAVMAGDLLKSRSKAEAFEWFKQTRKGAPVENWYEIAGNHDVRSGKEFTSYFPIPTHYGVAVGNILFLLLSDQSVASQTDISDETFNWWAKMVKKNQDKIIITISHAQLRRSGLLGSVVPSRRIDGSDRFEKVLREYRTAVWASGHSHLPHGLTGTVSSKKKFNNVYFVNVSSIGESFFKDSQSRFLLFEAGSNMLLLRSRNHTKNRFDSSLDHPISLKKPFVWDGQPAKIFLP